LKKLFLNKKEGAGFKPASSLFDFDIKQKPAANP
jgi:hypothetical protein